MFPASVIIMAPPAKYAFHGKAQAVITTQELSTIALQHLQALAWYHAGQALGRRERAPAASTCTR
jgi:hypothetical protein